MKRRLTVINLILTQVCNRQCRYCFARDMLTQGRNLGRQFMERDLFEQAVDLAVYSRATEIRFLGGEPTLHPEFIEFAQSAMSRRLKLIVFSNGLIPAGPLEFLCGLTPEQVGLLVNVNDESTYEPGEYRRLREGLGALGRRVTCGYNISQPNFNLEPILRLIPELGLYPSVRLGIAHPVLSAQNQFLPWGDARTVARRIIETARLTDSSDIILGLDCGFTLCMFKDFYDEVIDLRLNFKCTCQPVLDLTPDGNIWYCLALLGTPPVPPDWLLPGPAVLSQTIRVGVQHHTQLWYVGRLRVLQVPPHRPMFGRLPLPHS